MKNVYKILIMLMIFALPVFAFAEVSENLILPQNKIIEGDYIGAGNLVNVASDVSGDIYVAGGTVNITSNVAGDVIAAGGTVTISGSVAGNVRAVGGSVLILGGVGKNISVAGGNVVLERSGFTNGSFFSAGGSVQIRGRIAKDLKVAGANVLISGFVGQHTTVYSGAGKNAGFVVLSGATLNNGLDYTGEKPADIKTGATINGLKVFNEGEWGRRADVAKGVARKAGKVFMVLIWSAWFLAKLAVLLIFVLVLKKVSSTLSDGMISGFWPTLGWGAVAFFATPAAAFVLLFTIIGIPISLLMMAWYFIVVFLAFILAPIALGKVLAKFLNWKRNSLVWTSLSGFVILEALMTLGFIGFIATILAACWGLGGIMLSKKYIKE